MPGPWSRRTGSCAWCSLVTVAGEQVTGYELVADPARLAQLELATLGK